MKHLFKFSLLLLALLLPATATAHDFEVDGIYYNINGTEATVTYRGTSYSQYSNEYSGSVTIPATVTYGGTTYAVTSIGDYAFDYCYTLKSVSIPNSVTTIGNWSFFYCYALTSVTIPNSVTSIGDNAFYDCNGLTSITIPNSVKSIGTQAFGNCTRLTSIIVENGNPYFDSRNNCNAIIETASNTLITGCKNTVIPNSVTSIGYCAFDGCSGLTGIDIPNSITSIGERAFEDCNSLTSITIPNSVTSIGELAFYFCDNLKITTIGCRVTTIGDSAFYYCSNTKIYSLALTPPTIESNTFNSYGATLYVPKEALDSYKAANYWKYFTNIVGIDYVPPVSTFEVDGIYYQITVENVVSVIANEEVETFYTGDVIIPDSVTYEGTTFAVTGIEGNAFDGCFELTSITIPNTVETIGEQAFQGCTGLTSVTIGSGVTSIGAKAFNYCNALETVKCIGTVPPVMASADCFSTAAYNRATLLVPRNHEATYAAADYWYKFAHIDGWGSAGRGDVNGDGIMNIADVTFLIDAILKGDYEGVYFESADLNSNGRLDISDVTSLIDDLLYGN